jgi:hypothetical protein
VLTIAGRLKKRGRSTESSFESTFSAAQDRKNFHVNMQSAGWPDRYFSGGIWIEFKVLDGWAPQLEREQPSIMTMLENMGDCVFYCALVPTDRTVIFKPWHVIKGRKSLKDIERFRYQDKRDLKEIFDAGVREFQHRGKRGGSNRDGELPPYDWYDPINPV